MTWQCFVVRHMNVIICCCKVIFENRIKNRTVRVESLETKETEASLCGVGRHSNSEAMWKSRRIATKKNRKHLYSVMSETHTINI